MTGYFVAPGGLPPQSQLLSGRAIFTAAYAVIPHGVMTDIVTSALPFWEHARAWILARPLSGFAETFAHALIELGPGGGSDRPEPDPGAESVIFVVRGTVDVTLGHSRHRLGPGGYAFAPPQVLAAIRAPQGALLHWIRKAYERVEGIEVPPPFVADDAATAPVAMPDTGGAWATTRFVEPDDLRHDMHVNIVTLAAGAVIPFTETHVMEHGLYVLQGKAVYRLNRDWVEVEAGDYMWLRAFCPQACYAGGPGPFRYLLYKDVNRHPRLRLHR